jgi:hypothetical protein
MYHVEAHVLTIQHENEPIQRKVEQYRWQKQ